MRPLKRVLLVLAICVPPLVFALTRVDETVTERDTRAIEVLGTSASCRQAKGKFNEEIACFRRLQKRLAEAVPDPRCVHRWGAISHEPADVLARGRGCCFSRSRFIEKALMSAGYQVRHLALYSRSGGLRLLAPLFPRASHSTTEALTTKGWVVVDSNHQFVPVTHDGAPLTANELRVRPADDAIGPLPKSFMEGNYYILYGLHSRHGGFYRPYVPLPDIGWRDTLYNLME